MGHPCKRQKRTHRHEEGSDVKTEAEIGLRLLRAKEHWSHQKLEKAGRFTLPPPAPKASTGSMAQQHFDFRFLASGTTYERYISVVQATMFRQW